MAPLDQAVLPEIPYFIGSGTDLPYFGKSNVRDLCNKAGVSVSIQKVSAHRDTMKLIQYCEQIDPTITPCAVASAGFSAALPGVVSGLLVRKGIIVFGVAFTNGPYGGDEAFKSMGVQPGGVPVAFCGFDEHGLNNATILACLTVARGRLECFDPAVAAINEMLDAKAPDFGIEIPEKEKK